MSAPLAGKVAVVTGASRGIGKGIALVLAEAGARVHITARAHSPEALPGTLAQTAAECAARGAQSGGHAVPHPLDITDDCALAVLFAEIAATDARLDILVNSAMAIPADMTSGLPFWEKPLANWSIWDTGMRAAYVAAHHAGKIMAARHSGLIVALSGYVGVTYTYDVIFGTTKSATDRMMRDMAVELRPHHVAALSLWQGFTTTERAVENLKNVPGMSAMLNSAAGCSPEFPGRVIAALAGDASIMAKSGGSFIAAELAQEYGITDIDGRTIPSLRATRGTPIFAPIGEPE